MYPSLSFEECKLCTISFLSYNICNTYAEENIKYLNNNWCFRIHKIISWSFLAFRNSLERSSHLIYIMNHKKNPTKQLRLIAAATSYPAKLWCTYIMIFRDFESTWNGYLASVGKVDDIKVGPSMTEVAPK